MMLIGTAWLLDVKCMKSDNFVVTVILYCHKVC